MNETYLSPGEVADKVGNITRQTIHFYLELGLIKPTITAKNIYLFTPNVVDRIKKIQELNKDYKLAYIQKHPELIKISLTKKGKQ